jgi:hypothetical protein
VCTNWKKLADREVFCQPPCNAGFKTSRPNVSGSRFAEWWQAEPDIRFRIRSFNVCRTVHLFHSRWSSGSTVVLKMPPVIKRQCTYRSNSTCRRFSSQLIPATHVQSQQRDTSLVHGAILSAPLIVTTENCQCCQCATNAIQAVPVMRFPRELDRRIAARQHPPLGGH